MKDLMRRGHVIASHSRSHSQVLSSDVAAIKPEIVGRRKNFETNLGQRVRAFASLSGTAYGDNSAADQLVKADYQFVFSSFEVQRIRDHSEGDGRTTTSR